MSSRRGRSSSPNAVPAHSTTSTTFAAGRSRATAACSSTRRPEMRPATKVAALILGVGAVALGARSAQILPGRYGIGTPATAAEIRAADDDVTPTGHGLPNDSGSVAEGKVVY